MRHWERIYELHKCLCARRYPVTRQQLCHKLDCSDSTLTRVIRDLRDAYGAPIESDPDGKGYYYPGGADQAVEIPGLWFRPEELRALLVLQKLLGESQPRLFETLLAPLRTRLNRLISHPRWGGDEVLHRVRILGQGKRETPDRLFEPVATALLQRQRLEIRYQARSSGETTNRVLSPQRLVHYRDNWYLDAYCHARESLRTFAIDRIRTAQALGEPSLDFSEAQLDDHFADSYGIFGGPAQHIAVLNFTPRRARWVAEENWFPGHRGEYLPDGRYQLTLPYSDPRELCMDILKYGADVEVIAPPELRAEIQRQLREALEVYAANG